MALNLEEFVNSTAENRLNYESCIDSIIEKYNQPFDDNDIIDLETFSIVENKGQLSNGEDEYAKPFGKLSVCKRRPFRYSDLPQLNTPGLEDLKLDVSTLQVYNDCLISDNSEPSDAESIHSISSRSSTSEDDIFEDDEEETVKFAVSRNKPDKLKACQDINFLDEAQVLPVDIYKKSKLSCQKLPKNDLVVSWLENKKNIINASEDNDEKKHQGQSSDEIACAKLNETFAVVGCWMEAEEVNKVHNENKNDKRQNSVHNNSICDNKSLVTANNEKKHHKYDSDIEILSISSEKEEAIVVSDTETNVLQENGTNFNRHCEEQQKIDAVIKKEYSDIENISMHDTVLKKRTARKSINILNLPSNLPLNSLTSGNIKAIGNKTDKPVSGIHTPTHTPTKSFKNTEKVATKMPDAPQHLGMLLQTFKKMKASCNQVAERERLVANENVSIFGTVCHDSNMKCTGGDGLSRSISMGKNKSVTCGERDNVDFASVQCGSMPASIFDSSFEATVYGSNQCLADSEDSKYKGNIANIHELSRKRLYGLTEKPVLICHAISSEVDSQKKYTIVSDQHCNCENYKNTLSDFRSKIDTCNCPSKQKDISCILKEYTGCDDCIKNRYLKKNNNSHNFSGKYKETKSAGNQISVKRESNTAVSSENVKGVIVEQFSDIIVKKEPVSDDQCNTDSEVAACKMLVKQPRRIQLSTSSSASLGTTFSNVSLNSAKKMKNDNAIETPNLTSSDFKSRHYSVKLLKPSPKLSQKKNLDKFDDIPSAHDLMYPGKPGSPNTTKHDLFIFNKDGPLVCSTPNKQRNFVKNSLATLDISCVPAISVQGNNCSLNIFRSKKNLSKSEKIEPHIENVQTHLKHKHMIKTKRCDKGGLGPKYQATLVSASRENTSQMVNNHTFIRNEKGNVHSSSTSKGASESDQEGMMINLNISKLKKQKNILPSTKSSVSSDEGYVDIIDGQKEIPGNKSLYNNKNSKEDASNAMASISLAVVNKTYILNPKKHSSDSPKVVKIRKGHDYKADSFTKSLSHSVLKRSRKRAYDEVSVCNSPDIEDDHNHSRSKHTCKKQLLDASVVTISSEDINASVCDGRGACNKTFCFECT